MRVTVEMNQPSMVFHPTQMIGDQEPEETLVSPVITMRSMSIPPCPRRHCWPTRSSNGNDYSASANLYEVGATHLRRCGPRDLRYAI